jgi:hypothetical protein
VAVVDRAGKAAVRAVEVVKAARGAGIAVVGTEAETAAVTGVVDMLEEGVATAMKVAAAKVVRAPEVAAVVRVPGAVAAAAKAMQAEAVLVPEELRALET